MFISYEMSKMISWKSKKVTNPLIVTVSRYSKIRAIMSLNVVLFNRDDSPEAKLA